MSKLNVVIVGGHGKVALRLARILGPDHSVTSIIRDKAHEDDIREALATPLVLSLEDAPVGDFTAAFKDADVVYFIAGAGGKGDTPEEREKRTKKVDYEGAVKVFDAIEGVIDGVTKGIYTRRPRLIVVSAIDIRDRAKGLPKHYTTRTPEEKDPSDETISTRTWNAIGVYMKWKYAADMNLVTRDPSRSCAFQWTILRPGRLNDNPGTGNASIGRTHLTPTISRDDVATALALLLNREGANRLAIDMVGGNTPIEKGLNAMIEKGETDFPLKEEDYKPNGSD
ncbi:NADH(P)-binding-domain-containing protein [Mycena polygramma]|nr:NADH(P)-binding-domain-containing protein [Mycena polygramma]